MFRRITNVNTPKLTWKDAVAISKLNYNRLPQNIHEGDAKKLCKITSLLNMRALGPNSKGVRRRRRPVWKIPGNTLKLSRMFGEHMKINHEIHIAVLERNFRLGCLRSSITYRL